MANYWHPLQLLSRTVWKLEWTFRSLNLGDALPIVIFLLSIYTPQEGIEAFAQVFHDYPVTAVKSETLHLKSMCSMAGVGVIAISSTPAGQQAQNEIEQKAHYKYDYLIFPDDGAANCLFINGVVLHATPEEYPRSYHIWYDYDKYPKMEVPNSEMAKAGGLLTCSSILLH